MSNLKISGALYFLAGSLALMGIITAEAMYPSVYSTFYNEISDLGSTKPPNSIIHQPSASIFNVTMFLSGLMSLVASIYQHINFRKWVFTVPIVLFSLGLIGVGIFPGNISPYHGMSSLLAFLSGGIAAILCFKIVSKPFKYFSIVFGIIGIATWCTVVFTPNLIVPYIGLGGTERWIVYPIMLWLTGLGGYLMNKNIV
ncbi:DUF998 domain-containing protein [Rasiella sp. SM2506]|uniref:DUF998 domain-containing protein n=1 Tax=Rasiella sp. SM2506 TaxID=3423914 RepID=UPI003D7B846E